MKKENVKLLFSESKEGRASYTLPRTKLKSKNYLGKYKRKDLDLPEVSERQIAGHYQGLSELNFCPYSDMDPLGSCTIKYNPPLTESAASLPGFLEAHPYQDEKTVQGLLEVMYYLDKYLSEVTGMPKFTLQPSAGAHGESTGVMICGAYFKNKGEKRTKILAPDSAHGTNPASVTNLGFSYEQVKSNEKGGVDLGELEKKVTEDVALFMLTNPNTYGLFDPNIDKITEIVHKKGGLMYYDGANLNAIMGKCRPGDMGFDIVHVNLHKTFATPHAMGGPGAGPTGVVEKLKEFLPVPTVVKDGELYKFNYDVKNTIGKVKMFYGNTSVLEKAFAYALMMGGEGLKKASETAVVHANYMQEVLKKKGFKFPYGDQHCMHETIMLYEQVDKLGDLLADYFKKMQATIHFPIHDAYMIEPTETETKENIDDYIEAIVESDKALKDPEAMKELEKNKTYTPIKKVNSKLGMAKPCLIEKKE
ncbi:aminomethyl-transferring glycine dehydrogenase subunit GcvPB [Candidatus Woesearchaeota archaeon]|nr:aminomethyl-transferring glycine dehydrogenase subunit GcvPB [Candidatus Woesearchaeota archaeon]